MARTELTSRWVMTSRQWLLVSARTARGISRISSTGAKVAPVAPTDFGGISSQVNTPRDVQLALQAKF